MAAAAAPAHAVAAASTPSRHLSSAVPQQRGHPHRRFFPSLFPNPLRQRCCQGAPSSLEPSFSSSSSSRRLLPVCSSSSSSAQNPILWNLHHLQLQQPLGEGEGQGGEGSGDGCHAFVWGGGDDDKPREECGVVGILGDPQASRLCSLALHALQHRGQEGAGIVSCHKGELKSVTGLGLVSEVFGSDPSRLDALPGDSAIGHVRYSTAGSPSSPNNVQPFLAGYRFGHVAVAHNGNLVNYAALRARLEDSGSIFNTSSDTEVVLHLIAISKTRPFVARLVEACEQLEGAYSLLFLTGDKLYAVRDPHGFRPLVMGRRRANGAVVFASETCALDLIEADYDREVNPGEVVVVDADRSVSSLCLMPHRDRQACVFEHIYFALPNSIVFGRPVHRERYTFGATLATESPVPGGADVVIPVPDSGFFAALGYAEKSGVPFQQGLIRSHYVGRTFIRPSQEIRDLGVRLKLAPVRGILEGKRVVVVDDSIVRGTTSSKIVRLIRDAGAKEVHMRIASPRIVGSCYYGVDTPRSEELISNRMDVEGVRREIGSDSLAFLSLDSLRASLGEEAPTYCDACFTMKYPVPPKEHEIARAVL